MSNKRKFISVSDENSKEMRLTKNKKHTLDSDEEDSDSYEVADLNDDYVEGEEDGESNMQDEIKITPFNMREELEEGHFDKDGHYHWNKVNNIQDNWLDNIDWVKVQNIRGLKPSDSSDNQANLDKTTERDKYTNLLKFMKPLETIEQTLLRLGKSRTKLSSIERIRQKKMGIVDKTEQHIVEITKLANDILTNYGNMDIYQESYEQIVSKLEKGQIVKNFEGNDMYSDDFVDKEKEYLVSADKKSLNYIENKTETFWEYKWKEKDTNKYGPFSSEQMIKWKNENYFKEGAYVRRLNGPDNFYSIKRIDFELYL